MKLFLPIFKMKFPEIVDIALPAEGVFHNLVFVKIRKTCPMQAYKIMRALWGMGQMMFTKYIVVVNDDWSQAATPERLNAGPGDSWLLWPGARHPRNGFGR
jgi:4-hydroxy-3-polyprenylbenzoate decarboxylase